MSETHETILGNYHSWTRRSAIRAIPNSEGCSVSGSWSSAAKMKLAMIVGLGVLHAVVTVATVVPGYISPDEAIYHWMTKGFSDTGSLDLWNGFEEFPSLELVHPFVKIHAGRLYPQYPSLFAFLAWPFYRLAGYFGLFILNAACFVGLVFLCFKTAVRLFRDDAVAFNASLILSVATFAWDYSQAAWPHMASAMCIAAAFYLFVCSYCADNNRQALIFASASGLVAGFGPGIRVDTILVFPAITLPFLFARPCRVREALAVVAGALPGLAVMGCINIVKFGVFSPVHYGGGTVPLAFPTTEPLLMASAGLLIAWIATRPRLALVTEKHKWAVAGCGVIAIIAAVMTSPGLMQLLGHMLMYGGVSVVDFRLFDPAIELGGMSRTIGGGVVYIGGQKKALLQSLPYLALLAVPLVSILARGRDWDRLLILFVFPATAVAYYSYACLELDCGGTCLNSRYHLSCLPLLSILAAWTANDIRKRWELRSALQIGTVAVIAAAAMFVVWVKAMQPGLDELERPLLDVPRVLLFGLLILLVAGEVCKQSWFRTTARVLCYGLFCAALAWSGLVAFLYDYPLHRQARAVNYARSQAILPVVEDNSVFFVHGAGAAAISLIKKDRVRIAMPILDEFRDFRGLLDFHLSAGRRAYALFPDTLWDQIKPALSSDHQVSFLSGFPGHTVAEIARKSH